MSEVKPPLHLYVVWYSEFAGGQNIANALFTRFKRNVAKPTHRGLGVPVYFRMINPEMDPPLAINFESARRVAVVFLIDGKAKIDDAWNDYVANIVKNLDNASGLCLPVVFDPNVLKYMPSCFSSGNAIKLFEEEEKDRIAQLCFHTTHELCRLLSRDLSVPYLPGNTGESVKVFLSHTKRDESEALVEELRTYLATQTQLDSFLDVNSIPYGSHFARVIKEQAAQSAFIMVRSDSFCSSYWCQYEILLAKQFDRPIVVMDALDAREERTFPYLGNSPVLRYWPEADQNTFFFQLLDRLLLEVLSTRYRKLEIPYIVRQCGQDPDQYQILTEPPELLTLHHRLKSTGEEEASAIVLYPDPPLLQVELQAIQACFPKVRFTTPTFLLTQ